MIRRPDTAQPSPARGAVLVALAAVCWSSAGILIRQIESGPWQIVYWRSVFMAAALFAWLLVRHGRSTPALFVSMGRAGVCSALLLAATFAFFVLSITRTAVANTLLILAAGPFVSALLARLWLREIPHPRTFAAMVVAFAGIGVMLAGSVEAGGMTGDLLAIGAAVAFGSNTVVLRRHREVDMVPSVCLAGVLSAVLAAPLAWPLAVPPGDIPFLAALGVFQLSLGLVLLVRGIRHLTAAEVGLITLLETVLGPLWVWLGIGEQPALATLGGGGLVLFALVAHSLASGHGVRFRRRAEPTRDAPPPLGPGPLVGAGPEGGQQGPVP